MKKIHNFAFTHDPIHFLFSNVYGIYWKFFKHVGRRKVFGTNILYPGNTKNENDNIIRDEAQEVRRTKNR